MKSRDRRLSDLEKQIPDIDEIETERAIMDLFSKYGIPNPDEFILAIQNLNQLELVESEWVKGILAKGGKRDLQNIVKLAAKFLQEKNNPEIY